MVRLKKSLIFLFAAVAYSMAASTLVDSKSQFVLEDEVADASVYPCLDDRGHVQEGFRFVPENSRLDDESGMPYRTYRVALPSRDVPAVSLESVKTLALGKPFCKGLTLKSSGLKIKGPFLKDGLWVADVWVPLYEGSSKNLKLRKSFKLRVDFPTTSSGTNPGLRAVSRVMNPKGAARFGVNRNISGKALRKSASAEESGTHFLARFVVGNRNVATTDEDGLYAVEYSKIRSIFATLNRQEEIDGIPVDKIRIYGASPDTMPEVAPGVSLRLPNHLFEIPIDVRDHSANSEKPNGIFDEGDTILFVGYGTGFWKRCDFEDPNFKNGKMDYFFSHSPYSFYQYFQFGYSDTGRGKRFSDKLAERKGSGKNIEWMRYLRAEKDAQLQDSYFGKDLVWETSTGKEWFWLWHSRFDTTEVSSAILSMPHMNRLPGRIDGGREYVSVSYLPYRSIWAGSAEKENDQVENLLLSGSPYAERMAGINFKFTINGNTFKNSQTELIPGGNFRIDSPKLSSNGNSFTLTMLPNEVQYDRFDGYTVAYQWSPKVDSTEWLLPGKISGLVNVPVPTNTQVMKFVNFKPVGLLQTSGSVALDSVSSNDDVRYMAFRKDKYLTLFDIEVIPTKPSEVISDISRINSKTEYLIICPQEFMEEAAALAKFRSDGSAVATYATTVVTVEDIYRQYTGGGLSPIAIRNYIAYAYSVCPNLKYVLLAGSGHYDYRRIDSKLPPNYMPPYEKEETVIEDFFAVLDSGEFVRYGEYDLDLVVGRLPVSSTLEFSNYIEKAKDYEKVGVADFSNWRSNILLTADDARNGSSIDYTQHTTLVEGIAHVLDSMYSNIQYRYNLKKIYLLNYLPDVAGQKKEAAADFLNILNQGALMTAYFGHGSMTDWASEGLLKPSFISNLTNKGRYTVLNSFSCTVGRFDFGKTRSLSEEFLIANRVGSIASVGAARETFATYNVEFGKTFMMNALQNRNETIGLAYFKAKGVYADTNSKQRVNNEEYVLLGEPVIQMPNADLKIKLDAKIDSLKALDKMKISGTVSGMDEGTINLNLKEGRVSKRLFIGLDDVEDDTLDVEYDGSLIYSEDVPVRGGRFEVEFITPRKMSFGDSSAEFSAWAYSQKSSSVGRLLDTGIVISGFSAYADSIQDDAPPTISIQSCYSGVNTSFASLQTVKLQSPACLQFIVEDSTALDFREEADEGISVEIVGVESASHPLLYMEQTSKRAVFRKTFVSEQYPEGTYKIVIRASDVLGNRASKIVNIEITDDMKEGLVDVFNFPNPMGKKGTTFYFKNLAIDRASSVDIYIYNQNGRLVKTLKNAESGVTHWDGRDNFGRKLANGLYHYVVRSVVPATSDFKKKTWTKKQKLLISR